MERGDSNPPFAQTAREERGIRKDNTNSKPGAARRPDQLLEWR